MFEDLIKTKFADVETGDRDIATEIEIMILRGVEFGKENLDEEPPQEVQDALNTYFDKNMGMLVQMYLDEFSAVELIDMLDTELDELAMKKMRFQIKLNDVLMSGLFAAVEEEVERQVIQEESKELLESLREISSEPMASQSYTWDTKE